MVTQNAVIDAVKTAIRQRFPDEPVYVNVLPKNFERPSFLVENTDLTMEADTNGAVTLQLNIRVASFVKVDEYHNSQLEALNLRQYAILGLFAQLYLRVGDRALDVVKLTGTAGGRDWIDVTAVLEWDEDLADFQNIKPLPEMQEINLKMEGTT